MRIQAMNICGRITREPELRHIQSGTAVLNLSVAISAGWDKETKKSITEFYDLVAWGHTAEFLSQHAHKGYLLTACGELTQQKIQVAGKDGKLFERNIPSIKITDCEYPQAPKGEGGTHVENTAAPTSKVTPPDFSVGEFSDIDEDDENVPF